MSVLGQTDLEHADTGDRRSQRPPARETEMPTSIMRRWFALSSRLEEDCPSMIEITLVRADTSLAFVSMIGRPVIEPPPTRQSWRSVPAGGSGSGTRHRGTPATGRTTQLSDIARYASACLVGRRR